MKCIHRLLGLPISILPRIEIKHIDLRKTTYLYEANEKEDEDFS